MPEDGSIWRRGGRVGLAQYLRGGGGVEGLAQSNEKLCDSYCRGQSTKTSNWIPLYISQPQSPVFGLFEKTKDGY